MANEKKYNREKIIFDLSPKNLEELEQLKKDTKSRTEKQLIIESLRLMKTLNEEFKGGSEIIIENKDRQESKRLLFL